MCDLLDSLPNKVEESMQNARAVLPLLEEQHGDEISQKIYESLYAW